MYPEKWGGERCDEVLKMKKKYFYIIVILILLTIAFLYFGYEKGVSTGSWGRNRTIEWEFIF
jgi:hypothetical protein